MSKRTKPDNFVRFPGNTRPVERKERPAKILILPVIWIDGRTGPRKRRRNMRKTK